MNKYNGVAIKNAYTQQHFSKRRRRLKQMKHIFSSYTNKILPLNFREPVRRNNNFELTVQNVMLRIGIISITSALKEEEKGAIDSTCINK